MKQRIEELDALRGFAALAVVFFHYTLEKPQAGLQFSIGCMGVDLFFIISGFVIFMTIQKSANWKVFLVSRFSRLYPAYWTCATITTVFIVLSTQSEIFPLENPDLTGQLALAYVGNLTMFQYYLKLPDIDGSYWTLIIELVFYLFMLFILLIRQTDRLETYGIIGLLFVSLYSIDPIAGHALFRKLQMAIPLINYFPLFFAGIILYKMKFEERTPLRLGIFILTFILQCLLFKNCYRNRFYVEFEAYLPTLFAIYGIFLLFLYGKLTLIVNAVTLWLGRISYSMYLLHQIIGVYVVIPLMMNVFHLGFWPSALVAVGVVFLLAHLVNIFVEQPAMRYIRDKAKPVILK